MANIVEEKTFISDRTGRFVIDRREDGTPDKVKNCVLAKLLITSGRPVPCPEYPYCKASDKCDEADDCVG